MSFITWNQQGAKLTSSILGQKFNGRTLPNPDYICLQEVGDPAWPGAVVTPMPAPGWLSPYAALYSITGLKLNREMYDGYFVYWEASGQGNPRCSLAVLYKQSLGGHGVQGWWDGNVKHRPIVSLVPPGGAPAIASVHAPSGGNMVYVNAALAAMAALFPATNWRLVGDFNIDFPLLGAVGYNTQSSGGQTQKSGGNLDYSIGTLANEANCESADAYLGSDHLEVAFY